MPRRIVFLFLVMWSITGLGVAAPQVDPSTPPDLYRDFETLRQQLDRNPRDVSTLNSLGIVYARAGRLEDAKTLWRRGLAINPAYIHLYNNLGSALKTQKRYEEAVSVYRSGLAVAPSFWIHYNLGLLRKELNQRSEAARSFQECLLLNPGFEPARRKLTEMGFLQPGTPQTPSAWPRGGRSRPETLAWPLAQGRGVKEPVNTSAISWNPGHLPGMAVPGGSASGSSGSQRGSRDGILSARLFPPDSMGMQVPQEEEEEEEPADETSVVPRAAPRPRAPLVPAKPLTVEDCVAVIQKATGPSSPRVVALTFDDGPHHALTPILLDLLKAQGAPSTFFVIGQRAEAYPDIVSRMTAEGHEVGNHTWSHRSLAKQASGSGLSDLQRTSDQIALLTGKAPRLVRPPYGHTNSRVVKLIHGQGWHQVLWDADSRDWAGGDPNRMLARVLRSFSPGAVMLFHDIHGGALKVLPVLIPALKRCGYRFVTVSQLATMLNAAG